MTPVERTLFLIDKQVMGMLPRRGRVLYAQTLSMKRIRRKPPSIPIWLGRIILMLTFFYSVWCVYYVLSFAALKGGIVSTAWLISTIFANAQDAFLLQPLKCLIRFVILPGLFIRWLVRRNYLSIGRVRARQNWVKVRAFFALGLLKRDIFYPKEPTREQLDSAVIIQNWWRTNLSPKKKSIFKFDKEETLQMSTKMSQDTAACVIQRFFKKIKK